MDDRYDQPPRPSGTENIAARIQSLRNILSSERVTTAEQQVALQALDREAEDRRVTESRSLSLAPHPPTNREASGSLFETQSSTSPSSVVRTRRRLWRPRERLEAQRSRMERLARHDPTDQSMPTTPRLAPLPASNTRRAPDERDTEPRLTRESRPSKRRKVNDGTSDDDHCRPSYGLEGTLVPGNLKMIVLETPNPDTISPSDDAVKNRLWMADEISVYKSRTNKCSIFMKHQGGWPFTLTKLVIKAPKRDHDVAGLQGMVFVTMKDPVDDRLFRRTAHYDLLFPASYVHHRASRRQYDSYRPSYDYLHSTQPTIRATARQPRRLPNADEAKWCHGHDIEVSHIPQLPGLHTTVERLPTQPEDTSISPRSPRPWHDADYEYTRRQHAVRADFYRPNYTDDEPRRRQRAASGATAEAPPYTALSDNENDNDDDNDNDTPSDSEEEETPLYRGIPNSRQHLGDAEIRQRTILDTMREQRRSNGSYSSTLNHAYFTGNEQYNEQGELVADDDDNSRVVPDYLRGYVETPTGSANADASALLATGYAYSPATSAKRLPGCSEMLLGKKADLESRQASDVLMPHARFQITKSEGGGIAVHFEPAVSGKYILVKLWAQCPNSNVAVQSIVPYGYAGLRQVPDLEMR